MINFTLPHQLPKRFLSTTAHTFVLSLTVILSISGLGLNPAHAQTAYSYSTNHPNHEGISSNDKEDIINSFTPPVVNDAAAIEENDAMNQIAFGNNRTGAITNPITVSDSNKIDAFFDKVSSTSKSTFDAASKVTNTVLYATQSLIGNALGLLGVPYRYGGNTPEQGLDCSGFVKLVFAKTLGIVLPRRASDMGKLGLHVNSNELEPGDLVFFNTMRRINSHVGIYIGGGEFVHSPSTGGKIRVDKLSASYWKQRFEGGKRIANLKQ
jgi:cell wall-associated NlpC family hydrolase